jgi:hypothetical protein
MRTDISNCLQQVKSFSRDIQMVLLMIADLDLANINISSKMNFLEILSANTDFFNEFLEFHNKTEIAEIIACVDGLPLPNWNYRKLKMSFRQFRHMEDYPGISSFSSNNFSLLLFLATRTTYTKKLGEKFAEFAINQTKILSQPLLLNLDKKIKKKIKTLRSGGLFTGRKKEGIYFLLQLYFTISVNNPHYEPTENQKALVPELENLIGDHLEYFKNLKRIFRIKIEELVLCDEPHCYQKATNQLKLKNNFVTIFVF